MKNKINNDKACIKFIIDDKYETDLYSMDDVFETTEDDIIDSLCECTCQLNESTNHCECEDDRFVDSKITGFKIQLLSEQSEQSGMREQQPIMSREELLKAFLRNKVINEFLSQQAKQPETDGISLAEEWWNENYGLFCKQSEKTNEKEEEGSWVCYEIHRPNIPDDGCKEQCKECAEKQKSKREENNTDLAEEWLKQHRYPYGKVIVTVNEPFEDITLPELLTQFAKHQSEPTPNIGMSAEDAIKSELNVERLTPIQYDGIIRAMKKYNPQQPMMLAEEVEELEKGEYRKVTREEQSHPSKSGVYVTDLGEAIFYNSEATFGWYSYMLDKWFEPEYWFELITAVKHTT